MSDKSIKIKSPINRVEITPKQGNQKPPTKLELCLIELLSRGTNGLTELEAFSAYGETALHSTISTLFNDKGLVFKRERQPHTHRHGRKVYFKRYWLLDDKEITKARSLLSMCQTKRCLNVNTGGRDNDSSHATT